MSDPRDYHVESDREGFFIADDYGEDMTPTMRFTSPQSAREHHRAMVESWLNNYEPELDAPGWEGGFAENH